MFAGDPDAWAVAPDSPLPPFEDDIDGILDRHRPLPLPDLAAIYWLFTLVRRSGAPGKEARLAKEGGLLGAELVSGQILCRRSRWRHRRASRLRFTDDPAERTGRSKRKQSFSTLRPRSPGTCRRRAPSCWCSMSTRALQAGAVGPRSRLSSGLSAGAFSLPGFFVTTQLPSTASAGDRQREQRRQIARPGSCGWGLWPRAGPGGRPRLANRR